MQKLPKKPTKTPQKSFMKRKTKTFNGYINGFHLGGLQLIPDFIFGKNFRDFDADEWISYICLLHTKATEQEKDLKKLKRKLKSLTKI